MIRRVFWGFLALAGLILIAAISAILIPPDTPPLPEPAGPILIRDVRVIDVEAGAAGPPVSVSLDNGRIAAIGPDLEARGAPVVEGGGGFLVPGYWDMHMHSFQSSPQLHFPLFVAMGVTGVRDMMDCPGESDSLVACASDKQRWNRAVADGQMTAPRIISMASFYLEKPELTPAEVRKLVAIYQTRGLDSLKVYNNLSPAAHRAAGEAARELNMRLVGHLPRKLSLEAALANGQTGFDHARLFIEACHVDASDWRAGKFEQENPVALAERMVARYDSKKCTALFEKMREAGAAFVPTHVTREEDARAADPTFAKDQRLAWLDPLSKWAWRDDQAATAKRYPGKRGERSLQAYFGAGLRHTGAAYRAGVPVLVGTDTILGGFRYHDEMAHLVRAGLTPTEVLRAATLDAARFAGKDAEHGSVTVGKRADLVLLSANPLTDIANARKIRAVFVGGHHYDRAHLNRLLAFTRNEAKNPANSARLLWGFARSSLASEM